MSWKVTHIYEADFGCEERQAGAVDRCIVYLENELGEKKQIEATDEWLTANGIVEGSLWPVSDNESKDRLEQQLDFIREIDREKEIFRQTYLADGSRKEDDAEHAWHMAIMTLLLSEYSNESIDVLRTISMILIHDIVEIDAGDTYAYDEDGKKTQREREKKAADRIYGLLPKEQGDKLYALWEEFEEQKTPEAKFARVMDNIQPMLLNDASGGVSWKEHGVKLSQILKRNERTHLGSEQIWDYAFNNILKKHVENGNITDDKGVFGT